MATRPVTVRMPTMDQLVPPSVREAILRKLAMLAIGRIKRRTRAGLDVQGRPFRAYSTSYAEQRRRAGRETNPSLWLSGAMLNAMQILESGPMKVLIGFAGSAPQTRFTYRTRSTTKRFLYGTTQTTIKRVSVKNKKTGAMMDLKVENGRGSISNAAKAYYNDRGDGPPARHFFGLSDEDKVFLAKQVLRDFQQYLGRSALNRALGR